MPNFFNIFYDAYSAVRGRINLTKIALALLIGLFLWPLVPEWKISQPQGILAPRLPLRTPVTSGRAFAYKNYSITPLFEYELTARILARRNYYFFNKDSDLVPMDMVFGWGIMSDSMALNHASIGIMNHYYRSFYDRDFPYSADEAAPYLDNNHLIPANAAVERALKNAHIGNIVHLKGFLVEAMRADGYHWTSATTIGSVGDTVMTCKVIYVSQFNVVK